MSGRPSLAARQASLGLRVMICLLERPGQEGLGLNIQSCPRVAVVPAGGQGRPPRHSILFIFGSIRKLLKAVVD